MVGLKVFSVHVCIEAVINSVGSVRYINCVLFSNIKWLQIYTYFATSFNVIYNSCN